MAIQQINGTIFYDHDDIITSSGDNHNLDIHSSCIIIDTANNNDAVTGFIGETLISGERLIVINASDTNNLVIKHNTGSDAGNRILTQSGLNITLAPYETITLMYVDKVGRAGWWQTT